MLTETVEVATDPQIEALESTIRLPEPDPAIAPTHLGRDHAHRVVRRRAPGDRIGRFVIERCVGVGGMGVVYAAVDEQLKRRVAIKLIGERSDGVDPVRDERLLREAQAVAQLSHPNVVSVFDVGYQDGEPYVAMEYVDGFTLGEWLGKHPWGWREIVHMFIQAGRGLVAAHAAGIIHRDFKPSNVLIAGGRARVVDFGLARLLGGELTESLDSGSGSGVGLASSSGAGSASSSGELGDSTLTLPGAVLGTPRYMAPEQHRRMRIDARADQYAFCASLYEALYGEPPYDADTYPELAARVCEGEPPEPPRDREVPAWLREVVLRGLRAKRDERFPSMDALVDELQRDPEALRRRRIRAAGIGLVILVLAGLAGFGLLQRRGGAVCTGARDRLAGVWDDHRKAALEQAFVRVGGASAEPRYARVEREIDDYLEQWVAARTDACEATRKRGEQSEIALDARMRCLDHRLEEARALIDLFTDHVDATVLDNAVTAAARLGGLDSCVDVDALTAMPPPPADPRDRVRLADLDRELAAISALESAGKYPRALERARTAIETASALGYAPALARARFWGAVLEDSSGDSKAAEGDFYSALRVAGEARDDRLTARIMVELVSVVGSRQQRVEELDRLQALAEAAVARVGNPPQLMVTMLTNLGATAYRAGKYDQARAFHHRALVAFQRYLPQDELGIAVCLNNLGVVADDEGKLEEAEQYHQRALEIRERVQGPNHPDVAASLNNLGSVLLKAGKYVRARAYLERALEVGRTSADTRALHVDGK